MEISRENIDELNSIVTVDIKKEDYQTKVDKILKDYRKTANVPGFRKGHVPMGMIKKQYGQAVLVDEVNKLLQDSLNKYINDEKLEILGNPLPKEKDNFSWDDENYSFDFELGLAPGFEVDLKAISEVPHYKIVADDKMIDKQIKHIRTQYGKLKSQTEVKNEEDLITGIFTNEEKEIDEKTSFSLDKIKEDRQKELKGKKVGDKLVLNVKDLFTTDHILSGHLGLDAEEVENADFDINFEITEVSEQELAELNEDFYKKIFGEKTEVKTEEDFRNKIKEDAEGQFVQQSDQQLLNDLSEALIEETKFDLPQEFLEKWIKVSGEQELNEEQAKEEYKRSEKGLRYQLIENQIMKANDIKIEVEDIISSTKERIKAQMAQFGQMNPSEEELNSIAQRVLTNEQEARNFSEQAKNLKMLTFFKENANLKEKEVTFDEFIEEVTKNIKSEEQ